MNNIFLNVYKKQLRETGECYLRVKVRPRAAQTAVTDVLADETVKIDVAAPPERGKANAELLAFLAQEFALPKNSVRMVSGAGERVKLIKAGI